jgi:hypothetical protein
LFSILDYERRSKWNTSWKGVEIWVYGLFDAAENSGDTEAPISRLRE